MKLAVSLASACCALAMAQGVSAQVYPAKPIRLIVPFPLGGPTDTHSRWAAQQLNVAFGQPVVVENRAGAAGVIGTEAVAKAAPDGYTLLGGNPGSLTIAPSLRKQLGYDPVRDFAPITLIARSTASATTSRWWWRRCGTGLRKSSCAPDGALRKHGRA